MESILAGTIKAAALHEYPRHLNCNMFPDRYNSKGVTTMGQETTMK